MRTAFRERRKNTARIKVGLEPKGEWVGNIDYASEGHEKEWY
jgi:hypothetical protein